MEKKEFLNEEKYQKTKGKITFVAFIILIIGLAVGISLIMFGINKSKKIDEKYAKYDKTAELTSLTNQKSAIETEIENEKKALSDKKIELQDKIKPVENEIKKIDRAEFNGFDDDYYERQDKKEELENSIKDDKEGIEIIERVLNNSAWASSSESVYIQTYATLLEQKEKIEKEIRELDYKYSKYDSEKKSEKFGITSFYMFGGFAILSSLMFSLMIFLSTKRREIMAYRAQQIMPVAQEGMEKMAPTVANIGKTMAETMAPTYGAVAKEIAKGIKEGLKDEDKDENKDDNK